MFVGVRLAGFFSVVLGVQVMAMRGMGVFGRLGVVSLAVLLGCVAMMLRRVVVMLGSLLVMIGDALAV